MIAFVKSSGGIEYTEKVMHKYVDEANEILDDFKDSPFRTSLKNLIRFTIERKNKSIKQKTPVDPGFLFALFCV